MYELDLNEENIKKTISTDVLGRNGSIFNFLKLIYSINTKSTISIDGNWGTGKTFFVKQTELIMNLLNNPKGINMGARHISISTSGLVPKIYDLADENLQCTLSVSLHSPTDEKRSQMMPVNNTYNIEELMKACRYYIEKTNKRISFEYALAKENNDNMQDAKDLVKLLKGMLCHVNLIPINKIENGKYTKSTNENILKFRDYLNKKGIVATVRRELGSDIDAACGQLRKKEVERCESTQKQI